MATLNRLLFSCEFLSPRTLLDRQVPKLLADTDTYLALKIDDTDLAGKDYENLVKEMHSLNKADHLIPWPMLSVEEGYYANELTVTAFSALVKRVLEWYKVHSFTYPMGVIIDLEPSTDPAEVKKAEEVRKHGLTKTAADVDAVTSKKKAGFDAVGTVGKIIDMIDENVNPSRFAAAAAEFQKMQEMMHTYGEIQAIAVALPLAYEDIFDGQLLVQDFMCVPITHPAVQWDLINFMIFNTDYVAATKGLISHEDYRHLIYDYAQEFIAKWGADKASITLGITNVGIQDVPAVQLDPDLYRLEASALLAAGMNSVGIYALDGVLEQPDPKKWILTVKQANASDFTPNPDRMEFIHHIRKVFQVLDQLTPTLKYLVDSGKVLEIMQVFLKK